MLRRSFGLHLRRQCHSPAYVASRNGAVTSLPESAASRKASGGAASRGIQAGAPASKVASTDARGTPMKDIRWGWVLLGGLLGNVAVALLIIPVALLDGYERLGYVAPPASSVGVLIVGYWIARKAPRRAVLHGLLVGVFAVLIYIPVLLSDVITLAHILASALK